jgi:hypothetical protein
MTSDTTDLTLWPGEDLHAPLAAKSQATPGERIAVRFPIATANGTGVDDVIVRFSASAGVCEPSEVNLGPIGQGITHEARTTLTVAPLNGKREASVWANVRVGSVSLASRALALPIQARSRLLGSAFPDAGDSIVVTLENTGTAPAETTLEIYGTGNLSSPTVMITQERPGLFRSDLLTVLPGQSAVVRIVNGTIDHLIATATDGERTSFSPTRPPLALLCTVEATLRSDVPESGVRRDETFTSFLTLENTGDRAVDDLYLTLNPVSGAELVWDTITIDGARPIAADVSEASEGRTAVRVGRLAGGGRATASFAYRVVGDDGASTDVLRIEARVRAGETDRIVSADVPIDHRPSFTPNTTYLGAISESNGAYSVSAVITNTNARPVERVRVHFHFYQATPDDSATATYDSAGETRELPLRSTAMHERAGTFVDLGALAVGERVTVRLGLRPIRTIDDHSEMKVRAVLTADDTIQPIGLSDRHISGRVDLSGSTITRSDARPLRLAMPVEAQLVIRNDGHAPARDVRLALDLPPYLDASLPDAPAGTRWRPFLPVLHPGTAIATTITFFLHAPPGATTARIPVSIDAAGQSEFVLATLDFALPADPLIDPPRVESVVQPDGHIACVARVANFGDGVAREVTVSVDQYEHIVLRTTAVDGVTISDNGARSALGEGVALGVLEPGAYRDITWLVAPPNNEPYRAAVRVTSANGEPVRALSTPTRRSYAPALDGGLPEARRIDNLDTLASTPAARARSVELAQPDDSVGGTVALGGAQRETYALPAPQAVPAPAPRFEPDFSTEDAARPAASSDRLSLAPAPAQVPADAAGGEAPDDRDDGSVQTTGKEHALALDGPISLDGLIPSPTVSPEPAAAPPAGSAFADVVEDLLGKTGVLEEGGENADAGGGSTDAGGTDGRDGQNARGEPRPRAPVVAGEPIVITGLLEASGTRLALRMASDFSENLNLGWWRHIIFMRAMLPEVSPVRRLTPAWERLRSALIGPVKSVYPRTIAEDFVVTESFVDDLEKNLHDAIEALDLLAEERRLGVYFGAAEGATRIDAAVPGLLPVRFNNEAFDEAWMPYYEAAKRIFAYADFLELSPAARWEHHARANATLDEYLLRIVEAAARA